MTEQREPTLPEGDYGMGLGKLFIAILLAVCAYFAAAYWTSDITRELEKSNATAATQKTHQIPGALENFEKALQGMKETSDLLVNWTIVLFGGTIGIAILAKGAKIQDRNWGLIFIPSIWTLLVVSLFCGSKFKSSLIFQTANGKYIFSSLNPYLFLQMEYFKFSILGLIVLAVWYLFFRFSLQEDRGDGDDDI